MTAHRFTWDENAMAIPVTGNVPRAGARPHGSRPRPAGKDITEGELAAELAWLDLAVPGRYRRGAYACAACRVLEDFAATFGVDRDGRPGECPGPPPPVPEGVMLPGSDLAAVPYWQARPARPAGEPGQPEAEHRPPPPAARPDGVRHRVE